MPIEEAEKIAHSQFVWAILFYLTFLYYNSISHQDFGQAREEDYGLHEQSKADSNRREERLMTHLEKNNNRIDHNHSYGRRYSERNGSHE